MGKTTDELDRLAHEVSPNPPPRELDMLLTAGERISMALLAMAIGNLGHQARSYTGSQAGVITDSTHGKARIIDVTPGRIRSALDEGAVVIVAGFQGVSQDTKDITTLGRGASDTTAVALAAALGADVCEIYSDVDGVFTADPRIVPAARKRDRVSYEEMLEMAACGAKILHLRCVEYARRYNMPIHVRSSFSQKTGTWVTDGEVDDMEQAIIAGVAHDRSEAKITVVGVPDKPGEAAAIFRAVSAAEINIDMIVQNISAAATGLSCTSAGRIGPAIDPPSTRGSARRRKSSSSGAGPPSDSDRPWQVTGWRSASASNAAPSRPPTPIQFSGAHSRKSNAFPSAACSARAAAATAPVSTACFLRSTPTSSPMASGSAPTPPRSGPPAGGRAAHRRTRSVPEIHHACDPGERGGDQGRDRGPVADRAEERRSPGDIGQVEQDRADEEGVREGHQHGVDRVPLHP